MGIEALAIESTDFVSGYSLSAAGVGSLAVSLIIAWMTHRRASKADENQTLIDRQTLINEAYRQVLQEVREELERRDTRHKAERQEWEAHEDNLKRRIGELEHRVKELQAELASVKRDGSVGTVRIEEAHIDKLDGPGSDTSD